MDKATIVKGLRDLADHIDQADYVTGANSSFTVGTVYLMCHNKTEFVHNAKAAGSFKKRSSSDWLDLVKYFGPIEFQITAPHAEVCKRVVVGTKVVPAEPEYVRPAEPERVEEIIEWQCPDSILREDAHVQLSEA